MSYVAPSAFSPERNRADVTVSTRSALFSALVSDNNQPAESGTIIVTGQGVPEGKWKQYDIVFHWDTGARRFIPRESDVKLALQPNDFVVFHFETAMPGQPPCFIRIRGRKWHYGEASRLR